MECAGACPRFGVNRSLRGPASRWTPNLTTGESMQLFPRFSPASAVALACVLVAFGSARSQELSDPKSSIQGAEAPPATAAARALTADVPDAPGSGVKNAVQSGVLSGTVTDSYGDIVPGATVAIEDGVSADRRTVEAGDNGQFKFENL